MQYGAPDDRTVRVIVVGAGIGGLSAAIALRGAGHDVTVIERAPELGGIGAGLALFRNAMCALDRLGVREAVAAQGARGRCGLVLTSGGRELTAMPADLLEGTVAVHRGDLQATLAHAAGEVRLGAEVTSVEQGDNVVVATIADGTEERADLLVGADGLNSLVRGVVADARLRYAGYTAWRGVCAVSVETGRMSESWGVGERFGLIDIGRSRTYWFATKNAPEGEPDEPAGRRAEILRRFSGWHVPIAAVAGATPEAEILRHDVYYLEPLERWSRGRVVLLGDAGHATTPGIGQGAAQAIEDAVVLVDSLSRQTGLAAALAEYESIRRRRTETVLRLSVRVDRVAQLASPLACRLRNAGVRRVPERARRPGFAKILLHEL
jgi:2-polyprenyl-6-methoxyphenol hydroxylase-like FAD-dependent oxidoreductase